MLQSGLINYNNIKKYKMKRTAFIIITLLAGTVTMAQENEAPLMDRSGVMELSRIIAVLLVVLFIAAFIITLIRQFLEYRVKNKMIERGVPESVVTQFLKPSAQNDSKYAPIKWFTTLAGIGVGLSLVNMTRPIGIHSLAIMSFSIAASFLAYFLFVRRAEKSEK